MLFYAKQTLRLAGTDPAEMSLALHAYVLNVSQSRQLEPDERARIIRGLLDATVRQRPEEAPTLLDRVRAVDAEVRMELRRPTETELGNQLRHVVYPLLAAVIG
jgi:hypothetical protein